MKEIRKTSEIIKEFNDAFKGNDDQVIIYIADIPLAAYGLEEYVDLNYIKKNNIPTVQLHASCGTCVCLEKDICILSFSQEPTMFSQIFLNDLQEFLKERKIKSTIEGNDLLITSGASKFKVASFCIGKVNKLLEAVHISYSMNEDLINSICTKDQIKKPKGLKDFGIDYDELYTFIKLFTLQHNL